MGNSLYQDHLTKQYEFGKLISAHIIGMYNLEYFSEFYTAIQKLLGRCNSTLRKSYLVHTMGLFVVGV